MKVIISIFLLVLPFFVISQRIEIPKDNSANHLDLKLVYQPFNSNIQNSNGHVISSKKDSLLLLKVNGAYYSHKESGVSKSVFKNYLKECPEALKISDAGFKLYNKNRKATMLSNTLKFVGIVGTTIYGYKYLNSKKSSDLFTVVGFGVGMGTSILLNSYANSLYNRADKKMLSALDNYRLNCFNPIENPDISNDSLKNGGNNEHEKVLVDYFKNDARSFIASAGLSAGISTYSNFKLSLAGNAMIAKSGFSLSGDVLLNKFPANISESDEIDWVITASVPLLKLIKMERVNLDAGKSFGITYSGNFEGVNILYSLNIDGGIQKIKANVESLEEINDFLFNSNINRAGLSYNAFYFVKYKLEDNRFSPRMRYNMAYLRLYAHALLNMKTEYSIIERTAFNKDPKFNQYGGVLGIDILYSKIPFGSFLLKLEGGQYSYTGESIRFDLRFLLGLSLYLVP